MPPLPTPSDDHTGNILFMDTWLGDNFLHTACAYMPAMADVWRCHQQLSHSSHVALLHVTQPGGSWKPTDRQVGLHSCKYGKRDPS